MFSPPCKRLIILGPVLLLTEKCATTAHMIRAGVLCLLMVSCATSRREWELAGSSASRELFTHQVFNTDDDAAKAACAWLRNNEPKSERFEYCGFIVHTTEGYRATVPMTIREPTRCPRPVSGAPEETVAGWYHSHLVTNEFSTTDKSHGFAVASYLCAPNRLVKKLTPEGTVIVK